MEQQQILKADYLDILFDHRNKKYGGYELRKHYEVRARRALSGVLIVASILGGIPVIAGLGAKKQSASNPNTAPVITKVDEVHIYHPPKPVAPVHQSTAAPKASTVAIPTVIMPTDQVTAPPEQPVDLDHAIAGPTNGEGKPDALVAGTGDAGSLGTGLSDHAGPIGVDLPTAPGPIAMPDEMPAFNGDVKAFLQDHLNYPETAREAEKQGRVVLKFVVAEDGSITNVEVAKSVYASLDAEAVRVVKSMPRWKPGRVKGKAVKTYFALPITFALQ